MKRNKMYLFFVVTLLITLFSGCFNEKNGDQAKGVEIKREGTVVTVFAKEGFSGAVINVNYNGVSAEQVGFDNNVLSIVKTQNGNLAVSIVKKADSFANGEKLFTINTPESVVVELKSENKVNVKDADKLYKQIAKKATVSNTLLGDYNNDGTVNIIDFAVFKDKYSEAQKYSVAYDIAPAALGTGIWAGIYSTVTPDNSIDIIDFVIFAYNFGKNNPVVLPTSVNIVDGNISLIPTATKTLTVVVLPSNAVDKTVTWTSSNEAAAKVDSTGKVTAIANGNAVITAKTVNNLTTTIAVSVATEVIPVTSVAIVEGNKTIDVGATVTYTTTVLPANATDKTVTWTSGTPSVATVDATTGKVSGISAGKTIITATAGDKTSTVEVTVNPVVISVASVAINEGDKTINVSDVITYTALVLPANATDKTVTWTSGTPSVATVDAATGKVTGVAKGTTVITATAGGKTSTVTVTVQEVASDVTSVSISGSNLTAVLGSIQLSAQLTYAKQGGAVVTPVWASSDSTIATVDAKGKVTGVKAGKVTITATAGTVSGSYGVEVMGTITGTLNIHYQSSNQYGLHIWGDSITTPTVWPNTVSSSGSDSFGRTFSIQIKDRTKDLGILPHTGDSKDSERKLSIIGTLNDIWIVEGLATIFTQPPVNNVLMKEAVGTGTRTIQLYYLGTITDTSSFKVYKDGTELTGTNVSGGSGTLTLNLAADIDRTATYEVKSPTYGTVGVGYYDAASFEGYAGNDLGFTYSSSKTTFKLWSPPASKVNLVLYDNASDYVGRSYSMTRGVNAVWTIDVNEDLNNKYYLFDVTIAGKSKLTPDPYSKGASANSKKSLVFNSADTNPAGGWAASPVMENPEDAVIWEIHVRDFSIDSSWTGTAANRGKFLGMVESGTSKGGMATGFDHVKELGVNCVQILPMYDFSSVDETSATSRNWGYDPYLYNVPEGSYSSNPDTTARIKEMKQMINEFHKNGIRVVMDVVYNHTSGTGDGSVFDLTVPKYFYKTDSNGKYIDKTGCGNTFDVSKPMVEKFVQDSLKYWVTEYHIDGFRFDLAGALDKNTMQQAVNTVKTAKGENFALVYGEPWDAVGTGVVSKGDQKGSGYAVFNDDIRSAIKGGSDDATLGYATGDTGKWTGVQSGVLGSQGFTQDPGETINYISAHDNLTWFDKVEKSKPGTGDWERDKLGQAIVLTSQGIPFIHAGEEILRSKLINGDWATAGNSYNANDAVNKIDWNKKADTNVKTLVSDYYKGLIAIRKARKELRLTTLSDVNSKVHFDVGNNPAGTMSFRIDDVTPGDGVGDVIVSYNPTDSQQTISLPSGTWSVVADKDKAGTTELRTVSGSFTITPLTCMILFKK